VALKHITPVTPVDSRASGARQTELSSPFRRDAGWLSLPSAEPREYVNSSMMDERVERRRQELRTAALGTSQLGQGALDVGEIGSNIRQGDKDDKALGDVLMAISNVGSRL
jgi:hypothetical protein